MRLNLPTLDRLQNCQHILIAGMGGGFDVFCGLPIYFELQSLGFDVHLASLSDATFKRMIGARRLMPTLFGILPSTQSHASYFPERHLAQWFKAHRNEEVIIWCFEKLGVRPLIRNYRVLAQALSIDAVILVDGGVDSLMRGDEFETGSMNEDTTSLAVVHALNDIPIRIMACLGLGAEREVSYAHIFENITALTEIGAFWGSCSLLKQMESYQQYEQALLYVQSQTRQDTSVINSSIISAVRGHYGNYHLTDKTNGGDLWISPLMPIYWFFDLVTVAQNNLILDAVQETETFEEIRVTVRQRLNSVTKRPDQRIPLP